MGIDKIISPETEMGVKLAKAIMNESIIDAINFSDEYSILEINALEKWIGKRLINLDDFVMFIYFLGDAWITLYSLINLSSSELEKSSLNIFN